MSGKLIWLVGLIILLGVMIWWQWPSERVRVVMCDVGQGDSLLFTEGFSQLLVDTGPPGGKVLSCLSSFMPFWDRTIEAVLITHADADHSGSLDQIVSNYTVLQVFTTQAAHDSVTKITKRDKISPLWQNQSFLFGSLSGMVFWPPKQEVVQEDGNETSLVMRIEGEGGSVWLAGDADSTVELTIFETLTVPPTTILKVGHHGSKTSTSDALLAALRPKIALLSVGVNRYGHPAQEILDRLNRNGILVRNTHELGSVAIDLSRN